jgi:hypothetical protein
MALSRLTLLNLFFISAIFDLVCGKLSFIHFSSFRPVLHRTEISSLFKSENHKGANSLRKKTVSQRQCGKNPLPFQFLICSSSKRKRAGHSMMISPSSSEAADSLSTETSDIEICMVVPGQHDVRELADLCCRSFYGDHQWWSSLLNPISGMQRVILFEKVVADISNRIWKHQSEGCGSLHLAIDKTTGAAIGILLSPVYVGGHLTWK